MKKIIMKQNRREFISTVAAAGAAVPFISRLETFSPEPAVTNFPVRLFSKPIDSYDFGFMCECLVKAGVPGFDLTVRPGGKVEPDAVEKDVPKLVAAAKKHKLAADMMVTGILSATDPFTERILKTASASGVTHYRLGWFDYDNKLGVMESIQKNRLILKEISDLNRKYKIHGGYQNHAGLKMGAPVWDLKELLRDLPPEYLGSQYDVRHAMVEGANSWIIGMRLIAPHIGSLAIKDYTWQNNNGRASAIIVPLGEGMVNWDLFFKTVNELNIKCPLSLHIEYALLSKEEASLSLAQQQEIIVKKIKKDMDFLNSYLKKYNMT